MDQIKLYELMKSNEYSTYELTDIATNISEIYQKSSSDFVFKISAMLISALISYSFQKDNVFFIIFGDCVGNVWLAWILSLLLIPFTFCCIYFIMKFIRFLWASISYSNKKTHSERSKLINLFYRKTLNELFMAFSFEKKASMILENESDPKENKVDPKVTMILMLESLKYFEIALAEIRENKIIEDITDEISNQYIEYIHGLNAELVNNVLLLSVETLERICIFYDPSINPKAPDIDKCRNQTSKKICNLIQSYTYLITQLIHFV